MLDRVCSGAVLHPGTRLLGARTFIAAHAEVGREGPATLADAVLGAEAIVDGGYVEGAVMLERSRVGSGAHLRPGTVLEEQASTAHTVGLKHTILLSFVTLGSLINFCDCLMAGGTSRADHSEVGSGFIHFNFTPWGQRGDKATASLIGDVVKGVFLREAKIFLGGSSGLVGPASVGYGSVTAAGQVVRRTVEPGTLSLQPPRAIDIKHDPNRLDRAAPRSQRNIAYIAQLVALRAWYRQVRIARIDEIDGGAWNEAHQQRKIVLTEALANIELGIAERHKRLASFLTERGQEMPAMDLAVELACPLTVSHAADQAHVAWVHGLSAPQVEAGQAWLEATAQQVNTP